MKDIAVLLSGGVDSSVVVHLLCEQGFRPSLFYIKIGRNDVSYMDCNAEEDFELCTAIAHRYGLHLDMIDLNEEYWEQVASYAIHKIKEGLTPNPDVMCNKLIKFGVFEQKVGKYFDYTATGHYATTVEQNGKVWLGTAIDPVKDQTDFLAQITYLQVNKLMFPLGKLYKHQVREIASSNKLPTANRKDSQGICFLNNINYNEFVEHFLGQKEGDIIEYETGNKLGKHRGYWFHTIGQRKGLGLSGGPWFVVKKDIERNIIYVSHGYDTELQYGFQFKMRDFNFITENPWIKSNDSANAISFKIRHTPDFQQGMIMKNGDTYYVEATEKIQGIAPGQFGVIYDQEHQIVIGSGEICL